MERDPFPEWACLDRLTPWQWYKKHEAAIMLIVVIVCLVAIPILGEWLWR